MKEEKEINKSVYVKGKDYIMKWLFRILWNETESKTKERFNNSDDLDDETKNFLIVMSKYLDKVKLENPNLEFEHIDFKKNKNILSYYIEKLSIQNKLNSI